MRTTKRRYKVPKQLRPYLEDSVDAYSQEVIRAFHRSTGEGKSPWTGRVPSSQEHLRFKDLLDAHSIASREPSGILEGLWVDGLADYPLGVLMHDILWSSRPWQRPYVERAWRFYERGQLPWLQEAQAQLWRREAAERLARILAVRIKQTEGT